MKPCSPFVLAFMAAILPCANVSGATPDTILHAAELSRLAIGCRSAGLGDAGVALPLNAASPYWNPSISSLLRHYEFWVEGAVLYGGLSRQAGAFLHVPLQQGIGLSAMYTPFFSGDIPRFDSLPSGTRSTGKSKGVFQNNQHIVLLSVAKVLTFPLPRATGLSGYPLPVDVGVGCSFKAFWQTLTPQQDTRIGMNLNCDVGLLVRFGIDYDVARKRVSREVTLGASIKDVLPSKVMWINSPYQYEEPVYNSQYFGLGYIDKTGILKGNWIVSLAFHRTFAEGMNSRNDEDGGKVGYINTYHAGLEAEFWEVVAFRVGISDRIPVIGVGVHHKRFALDYSFKFDSIDYSPVRLGFGLIF